MDFTVELLKWYERHGRTLPWRETHDPYPIWLSEVILQQTRIQQGMAYWERFMQRFPTVEALAAASEDEVLRLWQGLGYYSRARHLHAAARQIVERGGFPTTLEGIRSLKGVGDYTAAAVASFAFGLPAAAVDGNAYRVMARYFGIETPINSTEGKKVFAALAAQLLPRDRAADYNQAVMDFGATWCTPQSPRCADCPLAEACVAWREGRVGLLPVKERKVKMQTRHITYIYVRCHGMTALRRRGPGDIWQGLWEPVCYETGAGEQAARELSALLQSTAPPRLIKKDVKHVLTHRILMADFYLWEPDSRPALPAGYVWIAEEELDSYAVPRLVEMVFLEVRGQR